MREMVDLVFDELLDTPHRMTKNAAVAPDTRPAMHKMMCAAVERSGALLTNVEDAEGLIWADPARPELFPEIAEKAIEPQLDTTSIRRYRTICSSLKFKMVLTCGKEVYAPAVAETVLALALSLSKIYTTMPGRLSGRTSGELSAGSERDYSWWGWHYS